MGRHPKPFTNAEVMGAFLSSRNSDSIGLSWAANSHRSRHLHECVADRGRARDHVAVIASGGSCCVELRKMAA
jgi:hypothetical protein